MLGLFGQAPALLALRKAVKTAPWRQDKKPPCGLKRLADTRAGLNPPPLVWNGPGELLSPIFFHNQELSSGCDEKLALGELLCCLALMGDKTPYLGHNIKENW